jgi:DNA polymerase
MTILYNDFETYCEIDLKSHGTSRYAQDPSCEVLMLAYAFDEGPIKQWVPAEYETMPADLREAMEDPNVTKSAWNKPFEWTIWKHVVGIETPHSSWRDTMVNAMACSLPGSLGAAGAVVGLAEDKKKSAYGKSLIREFCMPRKPTKAKPWYRSEWYNSPVKWEEFKEYNRQDVEAERAMARKLRKYDLPAHEWELWFLDQEINTDGLPINLNVVRNAMRLIEDITDKAMLRMREITGLDNPNSNAQLLPWLKAQGYQFDDLKAGHVKRALEAARASIDRPGSNDPQEFLDYAEALEIRQEISKASVKKFFALDEATDFDGYLRNSLQFAGAGRTWRWAGRKYQAQNLARPAKYLEKHQHELIKNVEYLDAETFCWLYDKPMEALSTAVRPVVQAKEGHTLIDADLNAIENRTLGWMSGDEKILDVFRNDRDPYLDFATYMFHAPYAELVHEYKVLKDGLKRTTAKPGVLGCGYRLSAGVEFENKSTGEIEATGLLGYAWNMGVKLTKEQAEHSVKTWRETFTAAVEYWYTIEEASKKCIRTGKPQWAGPVMFDREGPWMRMHLPSGRCLYYCRPRLEEKLMPWGKMKETLTYEGQDDKNQWVRIQTHGGKLTENADQAISRDLLATGMIRAKKNGLNIRLHVHDQIVCMSLLESASDHLTILKQCLSEPVPWAPDLPLGCAGFISPIFIKD